MSDSKTIVVQKSKNTNETTILQLCGNILTYEIELNQIEGADKKRKRKEKKDRPESRILETK